MPSKSRADVLELLLRDVDELLQAHQGLSTGTRGRQWNISALNRAAVVLAVSAWETFVEELTRESLEALKSGTSPGLWSILSESAEAKLKRFNTPNASNVQTLFKETLGISNVSVDWRWPKTSVDNAKLRLNKVLDYRHEIAHGKNPRPRIRNNYADKLPDFFRRLADATDTTVRAHIVTLGIANPWPQ